MDFGRLALARALTDQSVAPFIDRGVTPEMFPDPESSAVYKFVIDFYRKHQAVPSPRAVEAQFPGYILGHAPDPLSSYLESILSQYIRRRAQDEVLGNIKALQTGNPLDIVNALTSTFASLGALGEGNRTKSYTENTGSRYQRYLDRKNTVGLLGIPTPWPSLDDMTMGWMPEMYVGVAARPKTGKTWWMLRVAKTAWWHGFDVAFANFELPDNMMEDRADALDVKLSYEKFRQGLITDAEDAKYKAYLAQIEANPPAKWHWLHQARSISALSSKLDELKPKILFIDGAYLMDDERGGRTEREQQRNLSRGFKRLAQRHKIPVIISIQMNRTADTKQSKSNTVTASSIYGSDAFAQDVDVLLGLTQTDDQRLNNLLQIDPLAVREAKAQPIVTSWNFDTMEAEEQKHGGSVVVGGTDTLDFAA